MSYVSPVGGSVVFAETDPHFRRAAGNRLPAARSAGRIDVPSHGQLDTCRSPYRKPLTVRQCHASEPTASSWCERRATARDRPPTPPRSARRRRGTPGPAAGAVLRSRANLLAQDGGRQFTCFSRDISATGIGLLHCMALEPGEIVLTIPSKSRRRSHSQRDRLVSAVRRRLVLERGPICRVLTLRTGESTSVALSPFAPRS